MIYKLFVLDYKLADLIPTSRKGGKAVSEEDKVVLLGHRSVYSVVVDAYRLSQ